MSSELAKLSLFEFC